MKVKLLKFVKSSPLMTTLLVLSVAAVLLGGSSAYAGQSNALPGSPLYPLKQLWEQTSLALSFSPAAKAQAHLNIAQDRIRAVQATVAPDPVAEPALQTVHQNLNDALNQSDKVTDPSQRKEIKKSISEAAVDAEKEAAHANESHDASATGKGDAKSMTDQLKQVRDKALGSD